MPSLTDKWYVAGGRVLPPEYLLVEITSFCNLKCIMCPKTNRQVNTEENKVMSWEVFEKLIPLFSNAPGDGHNGCLGEAFLHPDIYMKMLKCAKQFNITVHTTSNGTLITEEIARQLVETGLDKLIVSLDAATPATYSKIRPPGKFENVIAGLRHIKEWKNRLGSPRPRIEMAFLGMKFNIGELPDAVRLAHEIGVEQVTFAGHG